MPMFKCKETDCNKRFPTEPALRMHLLRVHRGVGPQLGKSFPSRPDVKPPEIPQPEATTVGALVHSRTNEVDLTGRVPGKGTYRCEQCSVEFKNGPTYRKHMRNEHGAYQDGRTVPLRLKCPECQRDYPRSSFNHHLRVKHGIYQTGPRSGDMSKVKRFVPRSFYAKQQAQAYVIDGLHRISAARQISEAPAAPETPHFAVKVQALIQIAEIIANLKG